MLSYLIAFAAICCYAFIGPIAKKVGLNLPPFTFIAGSSIIMAIGAGFAGYFFEKEKVISSFHTIDWKWLVYLSLINLVGYALYLIAIRKVPIAQYDMFGIMMPIIGGLFAVYLLKEPFHARYILAIAFMSIGLAIAIIPDLRKK